MNDSTIKMSECECGRIFIGSPEAIVGGHAMSYSVAGGQWFFENDGSSLFTYTKTHGSNVVRATKSFILPPTKEVCVVNAAMLLALATEIQVDDEITDKDKYLAECLCDVDYHLVFEHKKVNNGQCVRIIVEECNSAACAILITAGDGMSSDETSFIQDPITVD